LGRRSRLRTLFLDRNKPRRHKRSCYQIARDRKDYRRRDQRPTPSRNPSAIHFGTDSSSLPKLAATLLLRPRK